MGPPISLSSRVFDSASMFGSRLEMISAIFDGELFVGDDGDDGSGMFWINCSVSSLVSSCPALGGLMIPDDGGVGGIVSQEAYWEFAEKKKLKKKGQKRQSEE